MVESTRYKYFSKTWSIGNAMNMEFDSIVLPNWGFTWFQENKKMTEKINEEVITFDAHSVMLQDGNYNRGNKILNIWMVQLLNKDVVDQVEMNVDLFWIATPGLMKLHKVRGDILAYSITLRKVAKLKINEKIKGLEETLSMGPLFKNPWIVHEPPLEISNPNESHIFDKPINNVNAMTLYIICNYPKYYELLNPHGKQIWIHDI